MARPGDWACGACAAFPCFARARRCFRCGAERGTGVPSGGGGAARGGAGVAGALSQRPRPAAYLGPQGAGGSRPLLGNRSAATTTSTATAAAAGRAPPAAVGVPRRTADGVPRVDAQGFQEVRGRGTQPKAGPPPAQPAAEADATIPETWAEVVSRSRATDGGDAGGGGAPTGDCNLFDVATADSDVDFGGDGADDNEATWQHDDDADEGEAAEDDEQERDPGGTEEELRAAWDDARETCRQLEKNPRASPQLVQVARTQRDEAEAKWRASKPEQPLSRKLRWAERALADAVAKQEAHQAEWERYEEEVGRRRNFFSERAATDEARTARKREALDKVRGHGGLRPPGTTEKAARVAATGIASDVGPALAAAAEKLEEGSPVWMELQAAMASLANVEDVLLLAFKGEAAGEERQGEQRTAETQQQPAVFDISDGGAPTPAMRGGMAPEGQVAGGATATAAVDRSHQPPAAALPKWAPKGGARWGAQAWRKNEDTSTAASPGAAATDGGGAPRQQPAVTAAVAAAAVPKPRVHQESSSSSMSGCTSSFQAQEEARKLVEEARIQQSQREEASRVAQEAARAAAAEAERLAREKRELLDKASPEERERAAKLYEQQMAIANAGFGSQQAALGAGLVQQEQVQRAVQGAAARGITADVDELMAMSPEQFAEWDRGNQGCGTEGQVPW